jgi:hypothetical protein
LAQRCSPQWGSWATCASGGGIFLLSRKSYTLPDHVLQYDGSRTTFLCRQGDGMVSSPSDLRVATGDSFDTHGLHDLCDLHDLRGLRDPCDLPDQLC